jgi:hypothetical protein
VSTNKRKIIDLSVIDLGPILVVAQSFIDAAHDFTEIAGWEKSGPSRALTSLHADALHKLFALRRRLMEARLYDLSRRPD